MSEENKPATTCRDSSLAAGETMMGSAPHVNVWYLLEYMGNWSAKAVEDSDLTVTVREWLDSQIRGVPNSRLLLIKQGEKSPADGFKFIVVVARESNPSLHVIQVESYEDLLVLDMPGIISDNIAYKYIRSDEPLFLVCTNGERDIACGLHGTRVYEAMSEYAGESVWQTTHLGGHRFAANVIAMPHGLFYGRVTENEARQLIDEYRQKRILLSHLRGRSGYTAFEQAAEYFARTELQLPAIEDLQRVASTRVGDAAWVTQFRRTADGNVHQVRIQHETLETPVLTKSAATTPEKVPQYRRVHT